MPVVTRAVTLVFAALLSLLPAGYAAAQSVDPFEASIRHLRKVTADQDGGSSHAMLLALRDLRDPAMQPFFKALVQSGSWPVQMDAILGLAELSDNGRVDTWLVSKLRSESDRSDAVRVALDMGRLGQEEIERILQWEDLQASARIVLLAEQRRLGLEADMAALEKLAQNPNVGVRCMAAGVLADMGRRDALERCRAELADMPPRERDELLEQLGTAAIAYQVRSIIDLGDAYVGAPETSQGATQALVIASLTLDPPRGVALWKKALGPEPRRGDLVRWSLILLGASTTVSPDAFNAIPADDDMLRRIADAGKAVAGDGDPVQALCNLYDLHHGRCTALVLQLAPTLGTDAARRVLLYVINDFSKANLNVPTRSRVADVVDAVRRLMAVDADAAVERLLAAEDDSLLQEAILMGMCASGSEKATEAAGSLRRVGAALPDSLALILYARHADRLPGHDLRQLGIIASGGGQVDETLQAQAAWLYLKHSGRLDQALARIVSSS